MSKYISGKAGMLPYRAPHICARAQSSVSGQGSVYSGGNFHTWQAPMVGLFKKKIFFNPL